MENEQSVQEPQGSLIPEQKNKMSVPAAIIIAGIFISSAVIFNGIKGGNSTTALLPQQASAQQTVAQQPAVDVSKVKTDGEPFIGNANAPVTMAYWSDYQCPFCQRNEETVMPQLISDYVNTGKLKIVFKDFQFLGPDSETLGVYARAVWATSPDKFYNWHKAIYDAQGTENTGWATKAKILSITKKVIGEIDTKKVSSLVISNQSLYQEQLAADKAEADTFGINGTPGFVIGKQLVVGAEPYVQFKQAIDATLAGK